jgi:hypothetical protein
MSNVNKTVDDLGNATITSFEIPIRECDETDSFLTSINGIKNAMNCFDIPEDKRYL